MLKNQQPYQYNHCIMVHELAKIVRISVRRVETIILDELSFTKCSTCWVPKLLSNEQKETQVRISPQFLTHYERESDPFLHSLVTCDEVWVHHFMPETQRASMEWQHKYLPPLKKAKTIPSAGKVIARYFGTRSLIH
jgi:hypothetical protein